MKRLLVALIPLMIFASNESIEKIDKILNYHFSIDLSKIHSPFYKRIENKRSFTKTTTRSRVVRYDYRLVSIINNVANVKVIRYVNGTIQSINFVFVKKNDRLGRCVVKKIKRDVTLKCGKTTKILKVQSLQIPSIKEKR